MNRHSITLLLVLCSPTLIAAEKHHEDPTKIITRLGAGYDGEMQLGGSIGLDKTRQLRAKTTLDGDEWSVGGSWLFEKGIVNLYVNSDEHRNSYNIGTYLPLSEFGVDTGKWMVFPMGGASVLNPKSDGDNSYGGYIGAFAIRPISDRLSAVTYLGSTAGSNSYYGYWGGAGLSYLIKPKHSLRSTLRFKNDDYDSDMSVSIAYTIEF